LGRAYLILALLLANISMGEMTGWRYRGEILNVGLLGIVFVLNLLLAWKKRAK